MQHLLFIGAFLVFAFLAPLKFTVVACCLILAMTLVVKVTAQAVANTDSTLGEAFKSVSLAFVFLVIALFTVASLSRGTSLGASAVIALISTMLSALLLWLVEAYVE